MIKIAIVFSKENYIDNADEIFEEHNRSELLYNNEPCVWEAAICPLDQLQNLKPDADAIMARGSYAELLQKYIRDKPVIEIPFLATDLLESLRKCRERYGSQVKVGVIAAKNMVIDSEGIGRLAGLTVNTYILEDIWNVSAVVDRALADGCDVVVGGTSVTNYAETLGVHHMFIKAGKECFWRAITSAKRIVHIARMEQERSGKLQLILNASQNGIISLDNHKVIDTVNQSACKILNIPEEQLAGVPAQDAPLPLVIKKLFVDNQEYHDEIVRIPGSVLTVRKYFIKNGSVSNGCVITFWQVSDITDFEHRIRTKVYSKGYVAKNTFDDIVGTSPAVTHAIEMAKRYSRSSSNILLIGKSGVGKELFAQSIHNHSDRRDRPFLAVNCAAIPESLLESEFFGYAGGAFTGAKKGGQPGYFELAHTGTIFLDEIGEMPLSLQSKLLRVIQEREIIRVGDGTVIPVDVRIISATNRPLEEMVANHTFREDLFFRLDVLRVDIPSLDQRREDIPLLVRAFERTQPNTIFTEDACLALQDCHWSGNIRHLFNICERLSVLYAGQPITAEAVRSIMKMPELPDPAPDVPASERDTILHALQENHYNRTKTAQALGMDRTTLWRKMKLLGL